MKRGQWKIDHCFAWRWTYIRNRSQGYVMGVFLRAHWVWFKKYTRVWVWRDDLERWRTFDTVLGHIDLKKLKTKYINLSASNRGENTMYDFTDDDEVKGFEALPAGNYLATVHEAEVKETKAGTGTYIKVQFKVVEGDHENRRFFTNFNITNPNDEAQRIGRGQLKNMMSCAGVTHFKLEDVQNLIGMTMVVKLAFKTDNYGDGNEVRGYETQDSWKTEPPKVDKNDKIGF